ncbi:MAG: histidine phosphatase family protein [Dermatophilaceae bacterium]|jgi:broad specificity phosphatase PhoE|nr:histidine phosphatase family protein [Actinomycetales bacterium]MBP8880105.1 histidine phosphatase family protein [Dermatophilaceae bacterium]MBP9917296.1 histidine phosphatase family protein [Dermatophilaceae bacterium]
MPTTTVVHLLRHGEVHNPDGVLYGRLPGFRLSELGHEMAIAVAEHLEAHDIVRVIASPLERAIETAAPIADSHELGIHVDPRLIEAGNFFEGKRVGVGDGALRQPRYWGRLVDPFTPSWGERYQGIAARMTAAIDDIRRDVRGHEAVVVSHQLPVWIARSKLEGRRLWHDPRTRECSLASLTSLHYTDDELVTITYSEPAADLVERAARRAGA